MAGRVDIWKSEPTKNEDFNRLIVCARLAKASGPNFQVSVVGAVLRLIDDRKLSMASISARRLSKELSEIKNEGCPVGEPCT